MKLMILNREKKNSFIFANLEKVDSILQLHGAFSKCINCREFE